MATACCNLVAPVLHCSGTSLDCGKPYPSQGHTKWITSVAWEPAHLAMPCRRFVSGSKDSSIRVWDAVTRQTLFSMSSHTLAVSCVKWGGDGLIYSGSKDCSINVWDSKVWRSESWDSKVQRFNHGIFTSLYQHMHGYIDIFGSDIVKARHTY